MASKRTLFFIEVAIFTAFSLMLDLLPFLKFKLLPAVGSISLAMLPVFIICFCWGIKGGLLSGFLWGVLQIASCNAYILFFWEGILEYRFAFTLFGFAGMVIKQVHQVVKHKKKKAVLSYICLGVFIGGTLRFLFHVVAGALFFAQMAPEGIPVWLYSFLYNLSFMLPSMVISILLLYFLFTKQPRTLIRTTF